MPGRSMLQGHESSGLFPHGAVSCPGEPGRGHPRGARIEQAIKRGFSENLTSFGAIQWQLVSLWQAGRPPFCSPLGGEAIEARGPMK